MAAAEASLKRNMVLFPREPRELRYFVTSLLRYFVTSLLRYFVTSLLRYFVTSLLRYFVNCMFDSIQFILTTDP